MSPAGPIRPSREEPADAELARRARAGERAAFDALVRRYSGRVFGLVLRWMRDPEDAREIAQEAFVRAWRGLPRFEGGEEFRGWLFRIAVNAANDELRARKRHGGVNLDDVPESQLGSAQPEDPLDEMEGERLAGRLERALARLNDEHRAVLLLRAREEMSYEEIAHALDIPRGTVMSRLARARARLRELLAEER